MEDKQRHLDHHHKQPSELLPEMEEEEEKEVTQEDLDAVLGDVGEAIRADDDPLLYAVAQQVYREVVEGLIPPDGSEAPLTGLVAVGDPDQPIIGSAELVELAEQAGDVAVHRESPTLEEVMSEPSTVCSPSSTTTTDDGASSSSPAVRTICAVCAASASGFRYYGAVVCNSCRAFFSRAAREDAHLDFVCKTGLGACRVDSRSWRSCQKCRFRRCAEAGMALHRVQGGAIRRGRRVTAAAAAAAAAAVDPVTLLASEVESKLSLNDRRHIADYMSNHENFRNLYALNFFSRDLETFGVAMAALFEGKPMSLDLHLELDRYFCYLIKKIQWDSVRLSAKDYAVLVEGNQPIASAFGRAFAVRSSCYHFDRERLKALVETSLRDSLGGDPEAQGAFRQVYLSKSGNGRRQTTRATFGMIYPPEMFRGSRETEESFRAAVERVTAAWPENLLQDMSFVVLMGMLTMCSPDFLPLGKEGKRVVGELQAHLAGLLYRYLKSRFSRRPGHAAALMGRAMATLSAARELREMEDGIVLCRRQEGDLFP